MPYTQDAHYIYKCCRKTKLDAFVDEIEKTFITEIMFKLPDSLSKGYFLLRTVNMLAKTHTAYCHV